LVSLALVAAAATDLWLIALLLMIFSLAHLLTRAAGLRPSAQPQTVSIMDIQGVSGSGKSTLLNLLAGFLPADHGSIRWSHQELTLLPPWERPITSVFQEHNLFEYLNVADNIGLGLHPGLKLSSTQKIKIAVALERVGLAGMGKRRPAQLSDGQRQRVALLRGQPLLLLDEPLTGLDPYARHILHGLLLEQKREGVAMILASHDEEDRQVLADKVWSL
jgi:thiamine transport system ATP-binding protein